MKYFNNNTCDLKFEAIVRYGVFEISGHLDNKKIAEKNNDSFSEEYFEGAVSQLSTFLLLGICHLRCEVHEEKLGNYYVDVWLGDDDKNPVRFIDHGELKLEANDLLNAVHKNLDNWSEVI